MDRPQKLIRWCGKRKKLKIAQCREGEWAFK